MNQAQVNHTPGKVTMIEGFRILKMTVNQLVALGWSMLILRVMVVTAVPVQESVINITPPLYQELRDPYPLPILPSPHPSNNPGGQLPAIYPIQAIFRCILSVRSHHPSYYSPASICLSYWARHLTDLESVQMFAALRGSSSITSTGTDRPPDVQTFHIILISYATSRALFEVLNHFALWCIWDLTRGLFLDVARPLFNLFDATTITPSATDVLRSSFLFTTSQIIHFYEIIAKNAKDEQAYLRQELRAFGELPSESALGRRLAHLTRQQINAERACATYNIQLNTLNSLTSNTSHAAAIMDICLDLYKFSSAAEFTYIRESWEEYVLRVHEMILITPNELSLERIFPTPLILATAPAHIPDLWALALRYGRLDIIRLWISSGLVNLSAPITPESTFIPLEAMVHAIRNRKVHPHSSWTSDFDALELLIRNGGLYRQFVRDIQGIEVIDVNRLVVGFCDFCRYATHSKPWLHV